MTIIETAKTVWQFLFPAPTTKLDPYIDQLSAEYEACMAIQKTLPLSLTLPGSTEERAPYIGRGLTIDLTLSKNTERADRWV